MAGLAGVGAVSASSLDKEEEEAAEETSGTDTSGSDSDSSPGFAAKHRCTDAACGVLFGVAVVALAYIFSWGLSHGNMEKLSHGLDQEGRICGVSAGVRAQPFLYYCPSLWDASNLSLVVDDASPICVWQCPEGPNATDDVPTNCSTGETAPYATRKAAEWYCLPVESEFTKASVKIHRRLQSFQSELSGGLFGTRNSWPVMLTIVLVATALGYVYLCLLRAIAKGLIWLCLTLGIVALVGLGYYLWTHDVTDQLGEQAHMYSKVLAVLSWVGSLLLAFLFCCCYGDVELSTSCVRSGTEVIWKMPLLLMAPLVKAIVKSGLAVLLCWGFIHLWSSAEITGTGTMRHFHFTAEQQAYLVVYVFVGVWLLKFVTALYQFSIAYAVAKWYDTEPDEDDERGADRFGIVEGVVCGVRYHAGSLALGSALIAILELFQRLVEYAEVRARQEGSNRVCTGCLNCLLCCCKCVEGILRFVSKNAYIDMAIQSSGFCQSVRNVGHVVIDHGASMALLNGATVVFQIVGVFAITAVSGLVAYAMLNTDTFANPYSHRFVPHPGLAAGFACVLGFIVAWAFMAVFDVATDTILICVAKDMQQHSGIATKAPRKMKNMFDRAKEKVYLQKQLEAKMEQKREQKRQAEVRRKRRES